MITLTQDARPDNFTVEVPDKNGLGPLKTWSYSARKVFEDCAYRSYLERVKKYDTASSPAADRGTSIHQQAEDYVSGVLGSMPNTLSKFTGEFEELRRLYERGQCELEGDWGFTLDWTPTGWTAPDVWARVKLDALVHEDENSARVIDYKTGKHWGNEVPHSQQALLYAIATFLRYPHIEYIMTEMWYLDHEKTMKKAYSRDQAMVFFPSQYKRAIAMTTATVFDPKPSKDTCRWCSFKEKQGEHDAPCVWGVM